MKISSKFNLFILVFALILYLSCSSNSGPSKLYVGDITDSATSNKVGYVNVDDLGNAVVGITRDPTTESMSYVLAILEDGTSFYITLSDGTSEPEGYPILLTNDEGTMTFSNWDTTANTVDITITTGSDTQVVYYDPIYTLEIATSSCSSSAKGTWQTPYTAF